MGRQLVWVCACVCAHVHVCERVIARDIDKMKTGGENSDWIPGVTVLKNRYKNSIKKHARTYTQSVWFQ